MGELMVVGGGGGVPYVDIDTSPIKKETLATSEVFLKPETEIPPPFFFLLFQGEPLPYQDNGERDTVEFLHHCDASLPNAEYPWPRLHRPPPTIYFHFSSVPLCVGHVCQTPFTAAAVAADFVPRRGGGAGGHPTVQVRRKTNVFIAGLFSFPKSGKTGPFHPGQGERGNLRCILAMHVSQEMKPSLHPSDASLTQEANVLASIGC